MKEEGGEGVEGVRRGKENEGRGSEEGERE